MCVESCKVMVITKFLEPINVPDLFCKIQVHKLLVSHLQSHSVDEGTVDVLDDNTNLASNGKLPLERDPVVRRRHIRTEDIEILHRPAVGVSVVIDNPKKVNEFMTS